MDDFRNINSNSTASNTVPLRKKAPGKPKSGWLWFFVVLSLMLGGSTAYLAKENMELKKNSQNPTLDEDKELVETVGKLMVLPTGEDPTIATVTDLAVLKDQPFFDRAQIGDKVLIYSKAKKAILFNPKENKVVEVAPINDEAPPAQTAPEVPEADPE